MKAKSNRAPMLHLAIMLGGPKDDDEYEDVADFMGDEPLVEKIRRKPKKKGRDVPKMERDA